MWPWSNDSKFDKQVKRSFTNTSRRNFRGLNFLKKEKKEKKKKIIKFKKIKYFQNFWIFFFKILKNENLQVNLQVKFANKICKQKLQVEIAS